MNEQDQNEKLDYSLETRGEIDLLDLLGTDCFPDYGGGSGPGCNDQLHIDVFIIDDLPNYPNCTFTVVYKYYRCEFDPLTIDYSISDYQITDHDCPQFSADMENAYYGSIWSSFIHDLDEMIYERIEDHLVGGLSGSFLCGQGAAINMTFYSSSCYKFCLVKRDRTGLYQMYKISCGLQCCQRLTSICFDANGNPDKNTQIIPPLEPTCEGNAILVNKYPCSVFKGYDPLEVPCYFRCN